MSRLSVCSNPTMSAHRRAVPGRYRGRQPPLGRVASATESRMRSVPAPLEDRRRHTDNRGDREDRQLNADEARKDQRPPDDDGWSTGAMALMSGATKAGATARGAGSAALPGGRRQNVGVHGLLSDKVPANSDFRQHPFERLIRR
jgi:hypothetical protein